MSKRATLLRCLALVSLLLGAPGCAKSHVHVSSAVTADGEPQVEATTTPLTFASSDLTLVGKLFVPERRQSERVPAVVIISGSGPISMDCPMRGQLGMGFAAPVPLCSDLAEAFGEVGVASLRYDKRSCGRFNKCAENDYPLPPATLTIDAFVDDARAAVNALRARPEIDPDAIFVLGHSEGATYVPLLLREDPRLLGGIMLAGPYRDIDVMLEGQAQLIRTLLLKLGRGEEAAQAAAQPIFDAAASVTLLRKGAQIDAKPIMGAPIVFWKSWLALSERARLAAPQVSQPMLLLVGDYDFNVPTTELELWRRALPQDRKHVVAKVACVTHAMNCVSQPNVLEVRPSDVGPRVAHGVTEAVQRFVSETQH